MYKLSLTMLTLFLVAGCAQEARYVDYEFGKAQSDAFDQQIAYKSPENADKTPTGLAGIHAEKIMDTLQYSYDKEIDRAPDNNFSRGHKIFDDDND